MSSGRSFGSISFAVPGAAGDAAEEVAECGGGGIGEGVVVGGGGVEEVVVEGEDEGGGYGCAGHAGAEG